MISKKQIITLVVVLALIGLAGIIMSVNKNTDNQSGEQVTVLDQGKTADDLIDGDNKLIDNTNADNSAKTKNMTDIKEFSYEVLK